MGVSRRIDPLAAPLARSATPDGKREANARALTPRWTRYVPHFPRATAHPRGYDCARRAGHSGPSWLSSGRCSRASRRSLHLAAEQRSSEIASMAKSISNVVKKTGRGRPRLNATPITLRVLPNLIKAIDSWRKDQPDQPIRTEAIRRLVAYALDHQANAGSKRSRRSG